MKDGNANAIRAIAQSEGVAALVEALGRLCEVEAKNEHGGAPGSITATRRKGYEKAARNLASVAANLRLDC
jgi:hypothetical protein